MNQASINRSFTTWSLLGFAAPSIVMMVFMSLYTIVDGIFISRFVGSGALSSLNIVYPMINIVIAIATMFATGGNAIVSRYLGEQREERARKAMTEFVVLGVLISTAFAALVILFEDPICRFLGANDVLMADCKTYLTILMLFAPACTLQTLFQSYFVTASRPGLGLWLTVAAGILNAVLDYVLIVPIPLGIAGAALATGFGQLLPSVVGLIFFAIPHKALRFCRFSFRLREIREACFNGSSEMIGQMATAITTFLFNIILMQLAGSDGVAAMTILFYGQFLFNAFYMGFAIGIAPVVGYQYGAGNRKELRKIYRISFLFTIVSSVAMTAASIVLSTPIVSVFTKELGTFALADAGFKIFAVNFLFSGVNLVSSGFFTALSNGKASAGISFARTFLFMVGFLLIMPQLFGVTGAWAAIPAAELATLFVCIGLHRYYFWKPGEQNYITE